MSERPELDPRLGAAFSARDARALGVTPSRLRATDLSTLFSGSRLRAEGPASADRELSELLRRCSAYVPVAPAAWAFSHATAARL